jgi:hypothetical protein
MGMTPERKAYQKAYYATSMYRAAWRRRKEKQRDWIKALKDKPCADCGNKFPPECMDFDHRGRSQKKFGISGAISSTRGNPAILEEIAKCDLVCANCHRIRTAKQMGWL